MFLNERLQGIVASMTRIPTFRRRFKNLVKVLYIEAIKTTASESVGGGSSSPRGRSKKSALAAQEAGSSSSIGITTLGVEGYDQEGTTVTANDKINDNGSIV